MSELVGFYRYDPAAELAQLNEIWVLDAAFKAIKPAALSRQILALTGQLEVLAQAKKAPRSKPPVNAVWNARDHRRFSHEATT